MKRITQWTMGGFAAVVVLGAGLAGCGGSSDGDMAAQPPPPTTDSFTLATEQIAAATPDDAEPQMIDDIEVVLVDDRDPYLVN